ncbi:PDGLE domain-containing protein [soil metagenome]
MTTAIRRRWVFWVAFAAATLVIAGIVSYFASSSPDGLDSATLKGCEVVEVDGAQQLTGSCIAQHAKDHTMAASPLADYAVEGKQSTGGIAGVIGVLVTVAVSGGAFWLIARTNKSGAKQPSTTTSR